jgi:gliding motility-associated-like protein
MGGFSTQDNNMAEDNSTKTEIVVVDEVITEKNTSPFVIIAEENDPIITENTTEIIEELSHNTVVYNEESQSTELVSNVEDKGEPDVVNTLEKDVSVATEADPINTDVTDNTESNVKDVNKPEEKILTIFPSGRVNIVSTDDIYEFNFEANSVNAVKIEWNFGDGKLSADENPKHRYAKPGNYTVSLLLISSDHEVYEETKKITIESSASIDNIPNVITPNGDRINDEFIIKSNDIESFSIEINDQFGNKIFESNHANFAWDGTDMSGNTVKKSVYVYYINAVGYDGTTFKIPGQIYVK